MSEASRIEQEASDFLARQDGDDWNAAEQARLDAWLDAATVHRVAWLRLRAGWRRADRLGALNAPTLTPAGPRPLRSAWRPRLGAAPIAAALALVLVLVLGGAASLAVGLGSSPRVYATEIGARESVPLADGTRVELNTATRLRTRVGHDHRAVWLDRGEAYFQVAHDARHPFVVYAGSSRVTVLGTRFSVRRDGDQVEVVVAEGRVRVDPMRPTAAARPAVVTRGGVLVASPAATLVAQKTSQDVANALSWRQGAIVFDQSTLAEAAREFNRYNTRKLVIADQATADRRIGGSFEADNVSGFARTLERVFGLKIEEKGDQIVVSS